MASSSRPLAVVTGASSGVGFHLARLCAEHGPDLVIAADRDVGTAVSTLSAGGAQVDGITADLSTQAGVDTLLAAIGSRKVDLLLANAGHGLGHAFLDQNFDEVRSVIDTNITGTLWLIQRVGIAMREARSGRILITGLMPGATDTHFFERADMMDTKVGADESKDDPADVAQAGFDAMMAGVGDVVAGMKNKIAAKLAGVTPASVLADQHRKMAEPGTAR